MLAPENQWAIPVSIFPVPEPELDRLPAIFSERKTASGLSYDQLANRSGLTRTTLMNLAHGRYHGDLRTWLRLSKAWQISLDELLAPVWEHAKGDTKE